MTGTFARLAAAAILLLVLGCERAGTSPAQPAAPRSVPPLANLEPGTAFAIVEIRRDTFATPEALNAVLRGGRVFRSLYSEFRVFDWGKTDPERDAVTERFRRLIESDMGVEVLSESPNEMVLRLSLRWDDPRVSADILNRLTDLLRAFSDEVRTTRAERATRVLTERTTDIQRKLSESLRALAACEAEHPALLVDDSSSARARYQQALADIESYRKREAAAKNLAEKLLPNPNWQWPYPSGDRERALAEQATAAQEIERLQKRCAEELEAAKSLAEAESKRGQIALDIASLRAMRDELERAAEQSKTDWEAGESGISVIQKADVPKMPAAK